MKVTVAIYEHHEAKMSVCFATHEDALRWRRKIATQFWEQELSGEPRPSDPEALADRYFELMADGDEYFRWDEYEVDDHA